MAYGVVHQFPGGTKEQYEASIAAVHPSDGSLPEGQIFHAAGPSADGRPAIRCQTPWSTPAARTCTSTSSSTTTGMSISRSCRTSGEPNLSWTTAFIVLI